MTTQTIKDQVQERFGANAAAYVTSSVHAKGASLGRLVELVEPQSHWRVLDIATGGGHTAFAVAPHVEQVLATDLTPQMLDVASAEAKERGLTNIDFQQADAESLPFEDAEFDLVTCRIAPHHFPDPQQFVNECVRVLKPSGVLAVIDNIAPDDAVAAATMNDIEKMRDPSHVRCLSAAEWQAHYANAGLSVTHYENAFKRMSFKRWVYNQQVPEDIQPLLRAKFAAGSADVMAYFYPASLYTDEQRLSPAFHERFEADDFEFYFTEGIFIGQHT